MVDPLKLFWVITNSTYLGTSEIVCRAKSHGESGARLRARLFTREE